MNISDALPIQFWLISEDTFNERINAFVDQRCYFQEFLITDPIKLQVSNETNLNNKYALRVVDENGLQVDFKVFTKTNEGTYNRYDLSFDVSSITTEDKLLRFYIQRGVDTFDSTFDSTFHEGTDIYKSDFVKFSGSITNNQGYGTFLLKYRSTANYAGINYPNDGAYFNLRVPCRFFQQRNNANQSSIQLSNSKVINTSVILKLQQYLEVYFMPDYMHNKIQLALAHAVRGSLNIDGYEWTVDESYERSTPDKRNPFQFGKIWLTRKNNLVRNII